MKKKKNFQKEIDRLKEQVNDLQQELLVAFVTLKFGIYEGDANTQECMDHMVEDLVGLIHADFEPWYLAMYLENRYPQCDTEKYLEAIMISGSMFAHGKEDRGSIADREKKREELMILPRLIGPNRSVESGILDRFYRRNSISNDDVNDNDDEDVQKKKGT